MPPVKKIQISPSILSADFSCLEREVKAAQDAGADMIHCDVMDGCFVPNITFGPFIVEAVRRCVTIPLDVHLMICNPEKYVADFCNAGASVLTVHAEACRDLSAVLGSIRKMGVRAGVSVNPDKPVDLFLEDLGRIDLVLIMTVYAGFGGQKFMADMLGKVEAVTAVAGKAGIDLDIEVDGGINAETALDCAKRGANVFVAGSYVFGKNRDYAERIRSLREAAGKGAGQRYADKTVLI